MRRAVTITLDAGERTKLERLKNGRRVEVRLAERAAIVLLAAVDLIHRAVTHVAPERTATAQSLMSGVVAGALVLGTWATIPLYAAYGGRVFWVMAGMASVGLALQVTLWRSGRGSPGATDTDHTPEL